jgi:predicted ATPase/class 3 adenylate cyclase/regulation of enolase protein 1 (concanavalin A-like superfamily)
MRGLPAGIVTFLFTDIEGSTQFWEQQPDAMRRAQTRHNNLVPAAIRAHRGRVFNRVGDQFCAVFARAADALSGALAVQRELQALPSAGLASADEPSLRVRIALHTGEEEPSEGDYIGQTLNRLDRVLEIGHGGQVLLSQAAYEHLRDDLPPGASLSYLGVYRLRNLQEPEQIYQLLHPDLPAEFPPLRSPSAMPNNLPQPASSFVGREREMEEVERRLGTTRLLTLTGAGGVGKTRLAKQIGRSQLSAEWDGIWLVELGSLTDAEAVPQAIATVLGVRGEPGQPLIQTLVEQLKAKSLLLLLDDCEHLLPNCARVADTLLGGCPRLRILATSREALKITGEQIYPVRPLPIPDPRNLPPSLERLGEIAAVRLFLDRGTAAVPSFALTSHNASAVAEVCHRLEGIPLAIELAAARLTLLSIKQIARLLDDRFRLLTGGSPTALPRQQTVRALIDWSYDLLTAEEQTMLRRLSVFAGGFTLEASELVCAGEEIEPSMVLDLLGQLVSKSLVWVEEPEGAESADGGPSGPDPRRYRMLDTIQQYAREKIREAGEETRIRGRHRDWLLALEEEALPQLSGPDRAVWLERLIREYHNLRAALSGVTGKDDPSLDPTRLARWGQVVEQLVPTYRHTGRIEAVRTILEDYVALCEACEYPQGLARGCTLLGRFLRNNPSLVDGYNDRAMYERAIAVCEAHGLHDQVIYPIANLVDALAGFGIDLERAESLARACLSRPEAQRDARVMQRVYTSLTWIAVHRADWEALRATVRASLPFGGIPGEAIHLILAQLEQACHRLGEDHLFRELCDELAEEYASADLPPPFEQSYLEAASPRPAPDEPSLHEEFEQESWHPSLRLVDPTGRSRVDLVSRPGWLGLYPPLGPDLFPQQDVHAPRLMTAVQGDFVAQTHVELGQGIQGLAGLLVWWDEQHFVRLELQFRRLRWERAGVQLEACVAGEFCHVGRGQFNRGAIWLRVERVGEEVRTLCSQDGEQWFTCGAVSVPSGPAEVGLAAISHGPGSHAWFDSFTVWQLDTPAPPFELPVRPG